MAFTKHKSLGLTCMPQKCTNFNGCMHCQALELLEIFTWHVPWEQQKLICIHKKGRQTIYICQQLSMCFWYGYLFLSVSV